MKRKPSTEPGRIEHAAIGAQVVASSTHQEFPGEGTVEALVDGNIFSRWSSDYSAPQKIVIAFDEPTKLKKLRLYWEKASAKSYSISIPAGDNKWTTFYEEKKGKMGPKIDEINMKKITVDSIMLDLYGRMSNTWGFSLYEIEAIGAK